MQSPGGIHDQHITPARASRLNGIVDDRAGVGTGVLADDRNADALSPYFELIDSGSAERVGSRQDYTVAFSREAVGHFGYAGGLPRSVDADNENHGQRRGGGEAQAGGLAKQPGEFFAQGSLHLGGVAHMLVGGALAQVFDQPGSGAGADIRTEQSLFEIIPELVGDRS